ncbi:uncharacterized protein LOC116288522 [Actinia tenebrosa]|uniref:Uncharacterized protein LOC116288522 n=1 Tax=Actinia tenebrosa TaxID=6105 RepID=A0A6P8H6T0_ACTTE|nr:uncharacterized protein LOC116288522 [Actinia tenebrosa]
MALTSCRSIFITGCNRGLGLEFVKQFLNLPCPPEFLFATCRSLAPRSTNELKQLASQNKNLHLIQLDVDNHEAIKRAVSEVGEKLQGRGLDILFNNAGTIDRATLANIKAESISQLYKTNVVGPLMLTQAFLPFLKKAAADPNKESSNALVLNMSSILGSIEKNTTGGLYSYRASKAALNSINRSLSVDLKPFGIVSVVLHPGWARTEMGGPAATVSISDSVSGMMKVIGSLDESKSGMFIDYKGNTLPW